MKIKKTFMSIFMALSTVITCFSVSTLADESATVYANSAVSDTIALTDDSFDVSELLISNTYNLSEELSCGGEIVSRELIFQDDEAEMYIVETLISYDDSKTVSVNSLSTTYSTTKKSKVHEIYLDRDKTYLVAKATLTASFKYDEATDYVSCTSKTKDMYVTSGSDTYFSNVELDETSGGGIIFKSYVTAYLSYDYGTTGNTSKKLTIKCKSDGTVS